MHTKQAGLILVLAAALLTGCAKTDNNSSNTLEGDGDGGLTGSKAGVYSLFDPVAASPEIPFPNDVLFAGFHDPTLNIPNADNIPFVTAANYLDGYSTTSSLFTDFIGFVDYNTILDCSTFFSTFTSGIVIIDTSVPTILTPCVDYTIQVSSVIDNTGAPISAYRSRVLIEPLKPFKPSTTYIVALTKESVAPPIMNPATLSPVTSVDGLTATQAELFGVASSTTPVDQQTAPVLTTLNAVEKATLEELRTVAIRPLFDQALNPLGIPDSAVLIAWSFTTQSTTKTLEKINAAATAQTIAVANTTLSTGDLGIAGLADTADIYAGIVQVPYFLANASNRPTDPLRIFWQADPSQPDLAATWPVGPVPCAAFAFGATINGGTAQPSYSTTICYPYPVQRSTETIPLLVTVPNGNSPSGGTAPGSGWPVVIFQHGITGDRTQMLAIAPALANAGFVTVAIDLPLHGITDTIAIPNTGFSPFYRNQLFTGSPAAGLITGERTFNLDLEDNATGAPGPDGTVDGSGTWFINLSNLTVSRDNLRQAASDLIYLAKSVGNLAGSGVPIDTTKIYFVGHSLGAIVGTEMLGVNTDVKAATLAMPGGGLAGLLDASHTFGPIISAGLAANGVIEGTDDYESFLRFAQTLIDSGDPINYAVAANANHSIHLIEVMGDTVVPNSAPKLLAATATQDVTPLTRYLSGTDPLIDVMGLNTVSFTPGDSLSNPGVDTAVQFTEGTHGTILTPAGPGGATQFIADTCEMQRETATFLALDAAGAPGLPIGGACP